MFPSVYSPKTHKKTIKTYIFIKFLKKIKIGTFYGSKNHKLNIANNKKLPKQSNYYVTQLYGKQSNRHRNRKKIDIF